MVFASKLVQALNSEEVQSTFFDVVFKPAWDTSMTSFGKGLGNKVGDMLAQMHKDFEHKLQQLKDELNQDHKQMLETDLKAMATVHPSNGEALGAAAPAPGLLAALPKSSRSKRRRVRRERNAEQHKYARELILQSRTILEAPQQHGYQLSERVANIETGLLSQLLPNIPEQKKEGSEWSPWQSAVPAAILQQQCEAAGRIQGAWRRFCSRRGALDAPACPVRCSEEPLPDVVLGLTVPDARMEFDRQMHDGLIATIRQPTFRPALAKLLADVSPNTCSDDHVSARSGSRTETQIRSVGVCSLEDLRIFQKRVQKTIEVELRVNSYKYKPGAVEASSVAL